MQTLKGIGRHAALTEEKIGVVSTVVPEMYNVLPKEGSSHLKLHIYHVGGQQSDQPVPSVTKCHLLGVYNSLSCSAGRGYLAAARTMWLSSWLHSLLPWVSAGVAGGT